MTTSHDAISRLSELQLEVYEQTGKLERIGPAPVLTIRPNRSPAPIEPAKPAAAINKSEYCVRKYLVVATYPLVVCHPPPEMIDELAPWVPSSAGEDEGGIKINEELEIKQIRKEQFFKLSYHDGVQLQSPYLCSVTGGPWTAVVTEEESCFQGGQSYWTFYISHPEVFLSWYGTWEDIPPYPLLHVFTGTLWQHSEGCFCCPGYQPCGGGCIPVGINCNDPSEDNPFPI